MIRIGTKFDWNGRRWTVSGFTKTQVLVTCGTLKTGIDMPVLLKLLEEKR